MKLKLFKIKSADLKLNKGVIYALSFLMPFLIMLLIYIIKGIFPFGDRAFLRMDLYHQYLPFHSELQYKLQNFRSLFYTYDVGLGTNFLTLFAYYLASPTNILLFFISKNYIIDFLGFMTIIKIALCGLTFSYYLSKKFKKESYLIIFFSMFYALSGYIGAYYWNIMWLDNIVLFPLLLYGFERAFFKSDGRVYAVTLALSILCNYYIATITCFMLIFYFIYLIISTNQNSIKRIFNRFVAILIPSLIGVLMSAILLIPIFFAFSTTASSDISWPKSIYEFFPILEVIARHMPLVKIENGIEHWPNIYSGILILPLIIYYFSSKKVSYKNKIITVFLILFFYACFAVNIANFVSHVFRYPNSLPARYSFIYISLILTLTYSTIYKLNSIDKNKMIKAFLISIAIIILLNAVSENTKFESFGLAIIFILIYLVIFTFYLNKKVSKTVIFSIFLFFISLELFLNMYNTSITTISRTEYLKNRIDKINLANVADDLTDDFYRIEILKRKTKDDGAFLNFPSASIFSSSCYVDGSDFYEKMGMEASMNAYSVTGATPFAYSLLDVKYLLSEGEIENESEQNLRFLKQAGDICLYENLNTLPLSFVIDDAVLEKYDFGSGNPATMQNNIARAYGEKVLLEPIDVDVDGVNASFKIKNDGKYFAFILDKNIDDINFQYGDTAKTFENVKRGYFLDLGYLNSDETYIITNETNDDNIQLQVFRFNMKSMKNLIDRILKDSKMGDINYNDTHIKYDIRANKDGKLILSIPYDKGWSVKVDGKKIETKKVLDFFLGMDVEKGSHEVEMNYMPEGFIMGALIELLGLFSFVIYLGFFRRKKQALDN